MLLLSWRLLTLLLVALSMALSFCHLMEMPVRLTWHPALWMQTTTFGGLYFFFGSVGAVIDVSAIVAATVLLFLTFQREASFKLTAVSAVLMAAGLALWFGFVAPMNSVMAGWHPNSVPQDFVEVRNQWEYAHACIAGIKFAGLTALLLSVLVETREPSDRAPPV